MIFLSLGTTKQSFMRAVDLMQPFVEAGERVLVQYGCTEPDHSRPGIEWVKFMDHEELMDTIREADAFFCHAGVGSVITSLMCDTMPIVIPREARFGEHVDDHQLDLATRLDGRGLVVVLPFEDTDVQAAVARASSVQASAQGRGIELYNAVRAIAQRTPSTRSDSFTS